MSTGNSARSRKAAGAAGFSSPSDAADIYDEKDKKWSSTQVQRKSSASSLSKSALSKRKSKESLSGSHWLSSGSPPKSGRAKGKSSWQGPLGFLGGGLNLDAGELKLLLLICSIACLVRLWKISRPDSVVFDEVHFGGFASKYLKSDFFMDVHPPLAKLLITLAGMLAGFRGTFDFKDIGKEYTPDNVPYVAMRMLPASMGILVVPLAYLTMRGLECRPVTAALAALCVTFENGLITQSRHILLDSPLIFFTALTTFFWVGFSNENDARPFSRHWWAWLCLTGVSLGAVVSCKWVGLFTIATIGLATIKQLWDMLGDLRLPIAVLFRHFVARVIGLIIIPCVFYMATFQIHFSILTNSGEGDGFMSSEFQHTLKGHGMEDTFADVYLGSKVTIKHLNTQGGYLHSHPHLYETGSKQQQITLYPHRDDNNDWLVLNITTDEFKHQKEFPLKTINNGMQIRLHHAMTHKKLHSHEMRPPISDVDWQQEVSGYGFEGFEGDANDYFVMEIEKDWSDPRDYKSRQRLRALRTKFRLRHLYTGCYLFSHKVKLPDWAFEQQEVTCNKNPSKANSLWYIERTSHPLQAEHEEKVNYRRPGFMAKFLELQKVMWTTNAGLTERHAYDSRPQSWPLLRRGINFWVKDHRQIYLIGNPVVWYLSTLAVLLYGASRALLIIRAKRGCKDFNHSAVMFYDRLCGFLAIGWALHYFPFFLMNRQLFLHHYFPALYFAILLLASVFDLATRALKPRFKLQIALVILLLTVLAFQRWSPLVYAGKWTKAKCEAAKLHKSWDFACGDYYDDLAMYDHPPERAVEGDGAYIVEGGEGVATTTLAGAVEAGPDPFKEKLIKAADIPKSSPVAVPEAAAASAGSPDKGTDTIEAKPPVEKAQAAPIPADAAPTDEAQEEPAAPVATAAKEPAVEKVKGEAPVEAKAAEAPAEVKPEAPAEVKAEAPAEVKGEAAAEVKGEAPAGAKAGAKE